MVNRIMMRQRFKQWVGSTEYILNIAEGAARGHKLMEKRRLRNNFMRYLAKVKELRRLEHINKRVSWFSDTRSATATNDVFQSWRLYVKQNQTAKRFLVRASNTLDKQLVNDGFSKWKQMCSKKRQKLYLDNIEELNKRKDDHEE